MRSLPTLCAVLLAAAGCASTPTPHGLVRVDLPGPEVGPGSPQERALAEAIGDVAFGEGLACQPGAGSTLLRCAAAAVGSRSRGVTLALTRSGTGYEVSIDQ